MKYHFDPLRSFSESHMLIGKALDLSPEAIVISERTLRRVAHERLAGFRQHYREQLSSFDPASQYKFAELPVWTASMAQIALALGLHASGSLSVLDIGMGGGAFSAILETLEHRVVGTDIENPWYRDLCHLLDVKRVICPVEPFTPYRIHGAPFDLITILRPTFHRKTVVGGRHYWGEAEWRFLLFDLIRNNLSKDGKFFLMMPYDKVGNQEAGPSFLMEWCQKRGAKLIRVSAGRVNSILIEGPALSAFR
ncbi:hypothetical protein FZC33_01935 [Labrys sp. KNU-23]|uniref:hypothetical protein n=1 Tax=Labrys sp. KNU-23 TaxID=2789216 RepID=UPI0011EFDE61|nr:hypothetical protein [Labrys sp. KNU-23]QEN85044.1 hypothetical protein FZC33_01935 [Labrys sp. KNU-23]